MRRIIINEHLSLDGVIQGPGGPDEDTTGGFELGGWSATYADDITRESLFAALNEDYDLLLGRFTFDIWEPYWPKQSGPIAEKFNKIKKYVATHTLTEASWDGTVLLNGDAIAQVKELKASDGPNLHIWGSADLIQSLFQNGLIDQINVWIYPVVLGKGKKLFAGGTLPSGLKLTKHAVSSTGVICASFELNGKVPTGNAAED
ncbi:dihydrofolate reductase family protein [Dyadobacter sp. LJ53]|uniref:dihydrofolate reductase family protein n=1 Tax=Dyadobacter chenwenxiniae TaxID=2906456 RepID=UPI001F4042B8|nr:dihydrofolate reductase family protein [Dyadobacter chenwenxiniae]MCF0050624.1 dihydrofolate reductase family protein [Dyadobacter chenwenxiniae]